MFNDDQREHMRYLASIDPTQLCWCGWYTLKEGCPNRCPSDLTAADKLNMRCEHCRNEPWLDHGGRLVHLHGCTPAWRAEQRELYDLGGEAG